MTSEQENIDLVKKHIGEFHNFPKSGIIFRDLFSALVRGDVCVAIKDLLITHIRKTCPNIDVVVGLEARGFLFSLLIASELGISCVPIRKKGKLPGKCLSCEFSLEYGTDVFEIQSNSIAAGQRVLIVDDLLATGGTLTAAIKLIRNAGGEVIECLTIMELTGLQGRKKIDAPVHSFIQYEN